MLKTHRSKRKLRMIDKNRGTSEKPRLNVYRSNKYIYAQIIDDSTGNTLAYAKGEDPKKVGASLGKSAKAKKIENIVFDRAGYKYHGKVKALAEAAREAGLSF